MCLIANAGVSIDDITTIVSFPHAIAQCYAFMAKNLPDGRVAVVVQGPRAACQALLAAMDSDDAPGWVGALVHSWSEPTNEPDGFRVG